MKLSEVGGDAPAPDSPDSQPRRKLSDVGKAESSDQSSTWYGALWRGLTHEVAQMGRGTAELAESMPTLPGLNFAREEGPRQFIGPPPKGGAPTRFPLHQGPWPSALSSPNAASRERALADTQQGIAQSEQQYQEDPQRTAHPLAAGTGRVLGAVGTGLLPGGAAAGAARMGVPGAAGLARGLLGAGGSGAETTGRAILGRMGAGAAGGAVGGAAQPVGPGGDYWTEKAKQVGIGAATGGALGAAGGAIGPPLTQAAQDAIGKFPHIAALVRGTAMRSPDNFTRGAMNQALDPIGVVIPPAVRGGHDLINAGSDALSDAYTRTLAPMSMQTTPKLAQDLSALKSYTGNMAADKHDQLVKFIETHLEQPLTAAKGQLTGDQIKRIQSQFGSRASSYAGSRDPDQQALGQALYDAREAFMDAVAQQNPAGAAELANVNQAYAMFSRVRAAANRDVDAKGYFTPHDLLMASRVGDRSAGKGSFAKGDAAMQAVGEAALGPMSAPKVNRILTEILGGSAGFAAHGPLGGLAGTAAGMAGPEIAKGAARAAQTPIARGIGTGVSALAPGGGSEAARGFESVTRREKPRHTTEPPPL